MNSQKNLWVALIAVGIIAIGALYIAVGSTQATAIQLAGGLNSCNKGNCTNFTAVNTDVGYWINGIQTLGKTFATVGTFTEGGGITASSTSASVTLAGTEFVTSNVLDYTVNLGSPTLTWNASTTVPCSVMTAGQVRRVFIRNATTTAASTLTIAGGTGMILDVSSTTVIAGTATGKAFASFDITKKANSDCQLLMTNFD